MAEELKLLHQEGEGHRNALALAILSLLVGAVAGLVGAIFRLGLQRLDEKRLAWITRAHGWGWPGILVVVAAIALTAAIAAWMVRRFSPEASGSGIPYVERQLREGWIGNPIHILLVKFFGGLLAIGSGLALGREGPSVQIGAGIGHLLGGAFRRNANERRVLLAAGAGAGLATAFNAPIAGAVFVLEELAGGFDVPISISTLGASAGAIAVARLLLGHDPDFIVPSVATFEVNKFGIFLILGIFLGFLGVIYSRAILGTLAVTEKLKAMPVEWRAAAIGALIGLVGWFSPTLIGGGDNLTSEILAGGIPAGLLFILVVIRFVLGPVSYSAGTPGGLFAPMLTIGSGGGLLFGWLWNRCFGSGAQLPQECAIVGMAALFTSVVRAPITGITLVIELTASSELLLPMLVSSFAAMTVATLLKELPIYVSLRVLR
jgi:chloride channel protein, CIC family